MASIEDRREINAPGPYFVDTCCISCAACWKIAPENFESHSVETYAFVKKQPTSEAERLKCDEALATCPVEAIGKEL